MALSNAINAKAGTPQQPAKIIPPNTEKCLIKSERWCQYWAGDKCALEECPYVSPREFNGANTVKPDNTQDQTSLMNADRQCFICGAKFKGFIGAVPICDTCRKWLQYVIKDKHCPGCGAIVGTPHQICGSCKQKFEDIGEL